MTRSGARALLRGVGDGQLGDGRGRLLGAGQAQRERRPAARLRPDGHLAAVVRGDVLDDRQAQPGAAGVARARGVHPVEPLEHALLLGRGDADPLVDDRDLHEVAVGAHPDADVRRLAGVRDGVVQQVAHRGDQQVVLAEHARAAHPADVEPDVLGLRGRAGAVDGLRQDRVHVDQPDLPERARHLQPGQLDDLVHQRRQPRGLRLHPAREPAHRLRVVGGVLDRLGEQRQRAHRGLELVRHVDDEVAPDRLEPPRLRQVLRQHHEVVRADLRDPHLDHQHARARPDRAAPRAPRRGSPRRGAPAR